MLYDFSHKTYLYNVFWLKLKALKMPKHNFILSPEFSNEPAFWNSMRIYQSCYLCGTHWATLGTQWAVAHWFSVNVDKIQ